MFKRYLMVLTMLLALPAFANAWYVSAKTSPLTGLGTISPTGNKSYTNGTGSGDYTVVAADGKRISRVTIDGVTVGGATPDVSGTYTVPYTGKTYRYIVAYFAADEALFEITRTVTSGSGAIREDNFQSLTKIPAGSARQILIIPNPGYTVGVVRVDSVVATTTDVAFSSSKLYVFTDLQANSNISATFLPTSAVTANAGQSVKTSGNAVANSATLFGSGSTIQSGATLTYAWTDTSTTAGLTFGTPAAASTTAWSAIPGTYTATLTVTSDLGGSATSAALVTVVSTKDSKNLVCYSCHAGDTGSTPALVTAYEGSFHQTKACVDCHSPKAHDAKIAKTCTPCHDALTGFNPQVATNYATCTACHNFATDIHSVTASIKGASDNCVGCHDVAAPQHGSGMVNDNNGIRAIMPEFGKHSHHITGATPTNAQCVVCHLEGKVVGAVVVIDTTKHMADAKTHLRNADDSSDYVWGGTEHANMDNFCFSCHDDNGALTVPITFGTAGTVTGFTGTATNPFGDTLTNGYDQVARAGVVDVKTAFTTTNASHHAVSGQRYKYRFSTLANATVWKNRVAGRIMPAATEIAEGHIGLDGELILASEFLETMTGDFSLDKVAVGNGSGSFTGLPGAVKGESAYLPKGEGEATLYEAEKFVKSYTPLGETLTVADNSTLHCGDCHTVGQWKPKSSTNADGSETTVAIGAHGSENEYLLRNSLGTDALHNNLTYVCFNCHVAGLNPGTFDSRQAGFGALHPVQVKNNVLGYATTHAVSAFHIQCLADSANNTGATNRLAKSWEADKTTLDYPNGATTLPAGGSDAGAGNITGIACTSCHNSGLRAGFGGIHGGDTGYTDGFGRAQKSYRFMPGMGNYRYAPPGGWDGKDTTYVAPVGSPSEGKPVGGCYTNGATDTNPGYSACSHHGTKVVSTLPGVLTGGTANAPFTDTSAEYTVREATAGNALVTRPLKY